MLLPFAVLLLYMNFNRATVAMKSRSVKPDTAWSLSYRVTESSMHMQAKQFLYTWLIAYSLGYYATSASSTGRHRVDKSIISRCSVKQRVQTAKSIVVFRSQRTTLCLQPGLRVCSLQLYWSSTHSLLPKNFCEGMAPS